MLDGVQFENDIASSNDLDHNFKINRLEYYISGFAITHDGGNVTEIEDLYVLVSLINKTDATIIDLGEHDIESLESIHFYFGIDEETNHADPSLWPDDHPLALKFPSMHWGWNSGYRFIALEGFSGPNMDLGLQFHGVGDEYYGKMEFPVSMNGEESYTVTLDAEYSLLLQSLDINEGIIKHGAFEEIDILSDNFKQDVFTLSAPLSVDHETIRRFDVYPNPSVDGLLNISLELDDEDYTINVFDVHGKLITQQSNVSTLRIENKGMYFVAIQGLDGTKLAVRKVIIQ
jgi:hypothetical protein